MVGTLRFAHPTGIRDDGPSSKSVGGKLLLGSVEPLAKPIIFIAATAHLSHRV
jgi:hypothetical protein